MVTNGFSSPRYVRGMSLIEVLVSVLVLGVGLLGIAAMQALALRGSQGSLESTQAVMASNSILESIRANRVDASSYNMAKTCTVPSGIGLVGTDKAAWISALHTTIGAGSCGQITGCNSANTTNCVITVFWDDTRAGGSSAQTISVEAQI